MAADPMAGVKIACVGECMIELNQIDLVQGGARLGFAGDTLNTSVYLSRLGCDVSYITNLGTDAFSTQMLHRFEAEGYQLRPDRTARGPPARPVCD